MLIGEIPVQLEQTGMAWAAIRQAYDMRQRTDLQGRDLTYFALPGASDRAAPVIGNNGELQAVAYGNPARPGWNVMLAPDGRGGVIRTEYEQKIGTMEKVFDAIVIAILMMGVGGAIGALANGTAGAASASVGAPTGAGATATGYVDTSLVGGLDIGSGGIGTISDLSSITGVSEFGAAGATSSAASSLFDLKTLSSAGSYLSTAKSAAALLTGSAAATRSASVAPRASVAVTGQGGDAFFSQRPTVAQPVNAPLSSNAVWWIAGGIAAAIILRNAS